MPDQAPPNLPEWLETQREITLLMAHDLRNPLAAVLANLNFLELSVSPEEKDLLEAVSDVKLSSEMLLRLVENLVTVARLEASPSGPLSSEDEAVSVAAAARTAWERVAPAAEAAGVAFELNISAGEAAVRGDRALVEQVVENLAGNAIQHVRRGQRARLSVAADATTVRLEMDDDGVAFGPPERDFGRDGQLEMKKRSDARYSRGLALYVVGLAARAMGGHIAVRGDDGKGHVVLTFPRAAG